MKHRHRDYIHPDRGKRAVLARGIRKAIRSCSILLGKTAEGVSGAIRVWFEPDREGQWTLRGRKEEIR
jgi:hypothetical protein